jgi:hypothetical protein
VCEVHDKEFAERLKKDPDLVGGGWFCVCAHGAEETAFQREVRESAEKRT